jgi:hypothetical protein
MYYGQGVSAAKTLPPVWHGKIYRFYLIILALMDKAPNFTGKYLDIQDGEK